VGKKKTSLKAENEMSAAALDSISSSPLSISLLSLSPRAEMGSQGFTEGGDVGFRKVGHLSRKLANNEPESWSKTMLLVTTTSRGCSRWRVRPRRDFLRCSPLHIAWRSAVESCLALSPPLFSPAARGVGPFLPPSSSPPKKKKRYRAVGDRLPLRHTQMLSSQQLCRKDCLRLPDLAPHVPSQVPAGHT